MRSTGELADPGDCRLHTAFAGNRAGRVVNVPDFLLKVLPELPNTHLPDYPPV